MLNHRNYVSQIKSSLSSRESLSEILVYQVIYTAFRRKTMKKCFSADILTFYAEKSDVYFRRETEFFQKFTHYVSHTCVLLESTRTSKIETTEVI